MDGEHHPIAIFGNPPVNPGKLIWALARFTAPSASDPICSTGKARCSARRPCAVLRQDTG